MSRWRGLIATACVLLVASAYPGAHHGAGPDDWAIWDFESPVEVCGVVAKAEFINPHAQVHVTVAESQDSARIWTFTYASPNVMARLGITRTVFERELFPPGTRVLVQGFRQRHKDSAAAHTITLLDGRMLRDAYFQAKPVPPPRVSCWS